MLAVEPALQGLLPDRAAPGPPVELLGTAIGGGIVTSLFGGLMPSFSLTHLFFSRLFA